MAIPRIRTIKETAEYFAEQDPGSYVSTAWLRKQVQLGVLPYFMSGNRVLLNLDEIQRLLSDPQLMTPPKPSAVIPTTHRRRIGRID